MTRPIRFWQVFDDTAAFFVVMLLAPVILLARCLPKKIRRRVR